MADLMGSIKAANDRVTRLLQKGSDRTSTTDAIAAMSTATAGGTTFGQEFNRLKAGRLQEENAVLQNLMGQKRLENESGNLDLRRLEYQRGAAKDLAARGDARYQALVDTTDKYSKDPKFNKLWADVSESGSDKMTPREMTELVHKTAAKLGISPSDKEPIEVTVERERKVAEAKAKGKAAGEGVEETPAVSPSALRGLGTKIATKWRKGVREFNPKEITDYAAYYQTLGKTQTSRNPTTGQWETITVWPSESLFPKPESLGAETETAKPKDGAKNETAEGPSITTTTTGENKQLKTKQTVFGTLSDMVGILNEAKAAGEEITGLSGAAKSKGGGIARQVGVDVSPRAEKLDRSFQVLQGLIGPLILNEKRLSETERKRLEKITAGVSVFDDDVSVREAIGDVVKIIERLYPDAK